MLSTFLLKSTPSGTQVHFAYCIREERIECSMAIIQFLGLGITHIISFHSKLWLKYEVFPEKVHELKARSQLLDPND
jgi:hypothetical protein